MTRLTRSIGTARGGVWLAGANVLRAAALAAMAVAIALLGAPSWAQAGDAGAATPSGEPGAKDVDSVVVATHGPIPTEWIDPDTGHRVVRLSSEDDTGSFYFHYNGYVPGGDKIVVMNRHGLATIDLKTRETKQVVFKPVNNAIAGHKTREVFYIDHNVVMSTNVDTLATRVIAVIPRSIGRLGTLALNGDDTLLAGSMLLGPPTPEDLAKEQGAPPRDTDAKTTDALLRHPGAPGRRVKPDLYLTLSLKRPMALAVIDIKTGQTHYFNRCTDWLNHVQMSPVDPGLILFAHEGPWHRVDRPWLIRADGSGMKAVHVRKMDHEISGHEFFGPDGAVWFDLQTPKGMVFWLARHDVKTGHETWYHLERNEWSVHYNISPDGALLCGDGGGKGSVAGAPNGKWIYLFRPSLMPVEENAPEKPDTLTQAGKLTSERLVNMNNHDYAALEPNATFTPDGKWLVFRSNMFGPEHVFAVEIAKAEPATPSTPAVK